MNDEYFEFFLENFGNPTEFIKATEKQIEVYRGVLPDKLLEYWGIIGFSSFQNGLFWITDPSEFDDVIDSFLEGTGFDVYDNYHVIARSAYGELYLWGERTGFSLSILPHLNWIKTNKGYEEDIKKGRSDRAIQSFFSIRKILSIDESVDSKQLFPSVLKKHGPIKKDEVMVFNPYLFMGGEKSVGNMSKENLHVFLQVIADLGEAEIVDMASMIGNVIKN
ncbi:DUF1851 domain-containing protein (plasmid) [Vibrio campbellii]|nr:DUF1851 domain-containing protein [Vibrio campbellii]